MSLKRIWVDADACTKVIKEILFRAADRVGVPVTLVLDAPQVIGAKTQRGYVVVAVNEGIDLAEPVMTNLRQVHTASVPMRVAQAQFAYRFREAEGTGRGYNSERSARASR